MFTRNFTVFAVAILLLSMVAFAGESTKEKQRFMKVVTPEMEAAQEARIQGIQLNAPNYVPNPASAAVWSSELGNTIYDYGTNNVMGRMAAKTVSNNINIAFMKRVVSGGDRFVTYNYADNGFQFVFGEASVTEAQATGWGRVTNGPAGEARVTMHGGGAWMFSDASEAGYTFAALNGGAPVHAGANFPGQAYDASTGTLHFTSDSPEGGAFTPDSYWYSMDEGATWTQSNYPPAVFGPDSTHSTGNAEAWPVAYDGTVGILVAETDINAVFPGGLAWHTSSDNGATWTSTALYDENTWLTGAGGQGDNYMYLVDNFAQIGTQWASDGTVHIVFNGYGLSDGAAGDSTFIFPIVYWNSNDGAFVELTSNAVGHNLDVAFSDAILAAYPGNGIGNAYPSTAVSNDGQIVFAVWQQVEVDGSGLPVIADDFYGNPSAFYATNVWGALSEDGGSTWSDPVYVSGVDGTQESFPTLAGGLWGAGDNEFHAGLVYYADVEPGVSLFGEGTEQLGPWMYEQIAYTPIGIEDDAPPVAREFILAQNYPNPFNPTTTISFQMPTAGGVSITVYDIVGREVKQLAVGNWQSAGNHAVSWDGTNDAGEAVSSGIYFYRLTITRQSNPQSAVHIGSTLFTRTRKMLLSK